MARITLNRYVFSQANWETLSIAQCQSIADRANIFSWLGQQPEQYGLTQCTVVDNGNLAIAGYLMHSYAREQRQLTADKGEELDLKEHAEKYVFVILPNRRLIGLQVKHTDGNAPVRKLLEQHFEELLHLIFSNDSFSFDALERQEDGPSHEEYYTAFFSSDTERVTEMKMRDFTTPIPEDFHYFNPDFDLNKAATRMSADDRQQLYEARLVALPNGNLKRSPTARGLIAASADPRELRLVKKSGEINDLKTKVESVRVAVAKDDALHLSAVLINLLVTAIVGSISVGAFTRRRRQRSRTNTDYVQDSLIS